MLRDRLRLVEPHPTDPQDAMRQNLQVYLDAIRSAGIANNVILAVFRGGRAFVYDILDHDIDPSSPNEQQRLDMDRLLEADAILDEANKRTPFPFKPLEFSHLYVVPSQRERLIQLLDENDAEWAYVDETLEGGRPATVNE